MSQHFISLPCVLITCSARTCIHHNKRAKKVAPLERSGGGQCARVMPPAKALLRERRPTATGIRFHLIALNPVFKTTYYFRPNDPHHGGTYQAHLARASHQPSRFKEVHVCHLGPINSNIPYKTVSYAFINIRNCNRSSLAKNTLKTLMQWFRLSVKPQQLGVTMPLL